jgi:hypothetical protein
LLGFDMGGPKCETVVGTKDGPNNIQVEDERAMLPLRHYTRADTVASNYKI